MKKILLAVVILAVAMGMAIAASDVRNTKHNLANWAAGTYKANNYSEVCVFCHTPHAAVGTPLWNRSYTASGAFQRYSSPTFGKGGTPDSASLLCFSCHEAVGTYRTNLPNPSNLASNQQPNFLNKNISKAAALGTDLRNDHPIGFNYSAQVSTYDLRTDTAAAGYLGSTAQMVFSSGNMTCASCHDVHGKLAGTPLTVLKGLLIRSNVSSGLCMACHIK